MRSPAVLALGNSVWEILLIAFIVLVPTVPITFFAWTLLGRRRRGGRGMEEELESGRSAATPFAMISIVGTIIAVAAITVLIIVVAVRAVAA